MQVQTNDVGKNAYIIHSGEPHQVVEREFVNPGKGAAFTRFRLRSHRTGNVVAVTIRSGELVELYEVYDKEIQYLYNDSDQYVFMDPRSYEQISISADTLGGTKDFL